MKLLLRNKLIVLYALFIAAYVALSLIAPSDKASMTKYHLHGAQIKVLSLTILVPYIVIWLVALVGYLRLRSYSNLIAKSKDGAAFKAISLGILWFTLWLPITAIAATYFSNLYHLHPSATAGLTRLENYINLIVVVPGFLFTYLGTKKLLPIVKKPVFAPTQLMVFGYIAFSALYVFMVLHDSSRQMPVGGVTRASYYEPDWLIMFTLVIPRLIMWFMGFQAVHNLYVYSKYVKGVLYKEALRTLATGLVAVVLMVIALRCLQSLGGLLSSWNLLALLLFLYGLLLLISVGYVLVAQGAQKLQKMEEL